MKIDCQFESIRPFLDGNGRVGIILMVLQFILAKRLDRKTLKTLSTHRGDFS